MSAGPCTPPLLRLCRDQRQWDGRHLTRLDFGARRSEAVGEAFVGRDEGCSGWGGGCSEVRGYTGAGAVHDTAGLGHRAVVASEKEPAIDVWMIGWRCQAEQAGSTDGSWHAVSPTARIQQDLAASNFRYSATGMLPQPQFSISTSWKTTQVQLSVLPSMSRSVCSMERRNGLQTLDIRSWIGNECGVWKLRFLTFRSGVASQRAGSSTPGTGMAKKRYYLTATLPDGYVKTIGPTSVEFTHYWRIVADLGGGKMEVFWGHTKSLADAKRKKSAAAEASKMRGWAGYDFEIVELVKTSG